MGCAREIGSTGHCLDQCVARPGSAFHTGDHAVAGGTLSTSALLTPILQSAFSGSVFRFLIGVCATGDQGSLQAVIPCSLAFCFAPLQAQLPKLLPPALPVWGPKVCRCRAHLQNHCPQSFKGVARACMTPLRGLNPPWKVIVCRLWHFIRPES